MAGVSAARKRLGGRSRLSACRARAPVARLWPAAAAECLEGRVLLSGPAFDFAGQLPPQYPVDGVPYFVAAADLDGDRAVDLVTANGSSDGVSVLRNLGDGTFAGRVSYGAGADPRCVAVADVDGDGAADVVSADRGSGTVSVLRNLGGGRFAAATSFAAGAAPYSVAAADVDGDGAPDLVTVDSLSFTASVLRNRGDGTFAAAVAYGTGPNPSSIAAADVDGDGAVDLVTANAVPSGSVSVLRNLGNGTFAGRISYAAGSYSYGIAAADLDGDRKVDLAVPNGATAGTVSVLINLGAGTPPCVLSATYGQGSPVPVSAARYLAVRFSEEVGASLSAGDFRVRNSTLGRDALPSGMEYDPKTHAAIVTFAPDALADGDYAVTVAAAGATDGAGLALDGDGDGAAGGDFVFSFFELLGDVDQDRAVGFSDLLAVAQHYGTPAGAGFVSTRTRPPRAGEETHM